jgi:hypothetical protein
MSEAISGARTPAPNVVRPGYGSAQSGAFRDDYLFKYDGAQKVMTKTSGIVSKEDLADFIETLRDDFLKDPSAWENHTVDRYLDAMAAWVRDMDGYYKNAREIPPTLPTWQTIADILSAARIYE